MKIFQPKTTLFLSSALGGFLCLMLTYHQYINATELKHWKKMHAQIVSTSVEKVTHKAGTTYCPKIYANFELLDRVHMSEVQISQESCYPIKSVSIITTHTYAVGKTIEVFVNPSNPSEVKLNTYHLASSFYLLVSTTGLMFLTAIFSLFITSKRSP